MKKNILLCAGGTGGHLFPAQAVKQALESSGKKNYNIYLATDERAIKLAKAFSKNKIYKIQSATFKSKNPLALMIVLAKLACGYFQSLVLLKKHKIDIVVGFGGYTTVPSVLAACHLGIKTIIHEQNAKMGRANLFLSKRATKVAYTFKLANMKKHFVLTGNPLRAEIDKAAKIKYANRKKRGAFHLLVFGGSQGAEFLCDIIYNAFGELPKTYSGLIRLTLQAKKQYAKKLPPNVSPNVFKGSVVKEFFNDMPNRIAKSHLVLCRSGAGSVCELAHIGRPSILVPLPNVPDGDQAMNGKKFHESGAAIMVRQSQLTAKHLAKLLMSAIDNPQKLQQQASKAKKLNVADASVRMVRLIESLLKGKN